MAHNDKQDKPKRSAGPDAHPSNQTPKRNNTATVPLDIDPALAVH